MPNKAIRFLLVDDLPENLLALETLLRRDGLEIHQARSATEALELMLHYDFRLAFVDVQMPGTNGYELAELMRGSARTREIPIIFVTAADHNEIRHFQGYEAGGIDYIYKPIDPIILRSKAEVFYRLAQQTINLERQRDELRESAQARDLAIATLRAHADNSPLGVIECDASLNLLGWSGGAERIFGIGAGQVLGRDLGEAGCFRPETLAQFSDWIANAGTVARHSAEAVATGAKGEINCEIYGSVVIDPATGSPSLSLQVLETTERHQSEKVRALLVGELNHRIKNTLANVQAIMRQTLRTSTTLPEFNLRFSGRLQALARAHSILSDVTWSKASLGQLVRDQIEAGTLDRDFIDVSGPDVALSPEVTLRLALILHELGTNAAKYGALSQASGRALGRVNLSWTIDAEGLSLTWQETGGPPVSTPTRRGFGSDLIQNGVGDGRVEVDWNRAGVIWRIMIHSGFGFDGAQRSSETRADRPGVPQRDGIKDSRVLLVEDEPLISMELSDMLEDAGARVVKIAASLDEAIVAARTLDFDVALLDGNLRGAPVDVVAHTLRLRGVPFCFISGYSRDQLPRDFQDAPLLTKPVDQDKLLEIVLKLQTGESRRAAG
ncbi:response regulator [Rhodobacter sp. 24-YEA-8]|uniref:response regulator n=1 Tax=Rhodobacter sp. 24-YEA-8 TaxID=1884310 RepID=UPI000894FE2D|nr:response regulator [Rhodobacter sp. 24-YEA-8]SED78315.1 Two-component sensor histidine kinase, contains HisKA and HATPase domains [Rhodobacter sp. 24-YEA-8]